MLTGPVGQIVASLAFFAVAGATHFLAYRWAVSALPPLARHRRKLLVVVGAWLVLGPLARFVAVLTDSSILGTIHVAVITEVAVVAGSALPLFAWRVFVWAGARLARRPPEPEIPPPAPAEPPRLTRRQLVEGIGGSAILATTASTLGWGVLKGRHDFRVEEVAVRIAGLPRALDGYTIAQVSDVHVGLFMQEDELRRGLAYAQELKPDLLVVTGDMVDFEPRQVPMLARALADLRPRDGVFAVPGNHDHYAGASVVMNLLRAGGVRPLVNEGLVLRPGDGGGFALLGVDDLAGTWRGGGPRLGQALAMVPDDRPRVLLSHQPQSIELWEGRVALQLSGHTHGGQINPGFQPARAMLPYLAGRYEVGATTLWVNRGFGTSGPPSRIGAPPEITKVVLVAA